MTDLKPVDALDVLVIVDNVTDSLSSVPSFVETEFAAIGRQRRGNWVLGGSCLCCAAHGLSCLIKVTLGNESRTLLFDTGPENSTFEQNVSRTGADLGAVEAIVLSHGHWDHGGAMPRALQIIRDRNGGQAVPYYAHPDMFYTRAIIQADGRMRPMEDVPSIEDLTAQGAEVITTRDAQVLFGGMACVSGEIPRRTSFEGGLAGQYRKREDDSWEPDELIMDERFVVVHLRGRGLVVFTACSHAGIVNVLAHARSWYPKVPLFAVIGGLHLSGSNEKIIPQTVEALRGFNLSVIAAGHCTGWRAMNALANAFGDEKVTPLAVGKRIALHDWRAVTK